MSSINIGLICTGNLADNKDYFGLPADFYPGWKSDRFLLLKQVLEKYMEIGALTFMGFTARFFLILS